MSGECASKKDDHPFRRHPGPLVERRGSGGVLTVNRERHRRPTFSGSLREGGMQQPGGDAATPRLGHHTQDPHMTGVAFDARVVLDAQADRLALEPREPPSLGPGVAPITEPGDPLFVGMRHEPEVFGEGDLVDAMQETAVRIAGGDGDRHSGRWCGFRVMLRP